VTSATSTDHPSRNQLAARVGTAVQFGLLALAWGASFLFIKIGLQDLEPAQVVAARLLLGALTLAVIIAAKREKVPRNPRLWAHLTVVGVLLCVLPFTLFAWAEKYVSSGLASIYNATTPLTTLALAILVLSEERLSAGRSVGFALGFLGVVTIIGPWAGALGGGSLVAQLACVAATVSYGVAFVYLRKFVAGRSYSAVTIAFIQVSVSAVLALALAWPVTTSPLHLSVAVVAAMVVLGAVGTGLAYVWNTNVVQAWGAANAAAVTYLTPVVGVALGVIVLDEPMSWNQPLGATVVVLGVLAVHGRLRLRRNPVTRD
jgi:drug/metabolite transporter (DMT)-like permease